MSTLEKDIATPLPQQLYSILCERIASGHYQAGRKLDSVRTLAGEFNVSTLVVNQALELLERDHLIVRMPARGIYVSTRKDLNKKSLRVILVFPEIAISPDVLNLSDWYTNTEIYNGMLRAALPENVQVHFQYFPEARDEFELREHLHQLSGYDAAVFFGEQRRPLRLRAAERVPILIHLPLGHSKASGESVAINFSQEDSIRLLADFALGRSYRNQACVNFRSGSETVDAFFQWREQFFRAEAAGRGRLIPDSMTATLPCDDEQALEEMTVFLHRQRPDFIFVNYTDKLTLVYDAVYKAGLRVGHDTDLMYIGPVGVFPACSSIALPYYQMGQMAIEKVIAAGRGSEPFTPGSILLPSRIHLGTSTRKDRPVRTVEKAVL